MRGMSLHLPLCAARACCRRALIPRIPPLACGCGRGVSTAPAGADLCHRTAQALYSMERFHRDSANAEERRQVERQAWRELQGLPDDAVTENVSATDIAEILGAWCYFSRFWAQGLRGPAEDDAGGGESDVAVPLVERRAPTGKPWTDDRAPPPRSNPLDEVLEF